MTRNDLFLGVIGGFDISAGLYRLTEAIKDDSAWGAVWACTLLATGGVLVAISYHERRKAEKAATLTTGR